LPLTIAEIPPERWANPEINPKVRVADHPESSNSRPQGRF
jgi:hypothetical protein